MSKYGGYEDQQFIAELYDLVDLRAIARCRTAAVTVTECYPGKKKPLRKEGALFTQIQ